MTELSTDDIEQFWENVEKTETCWKWTGPTFAAGYGYINTPGGKVHARKIALVISNRDWKGRIFHTCGNRQCVHPDHLSPKKGMKKMPKKNYWDSKQYKTRLQSPPGSSLDKFHHYASILERLPRPTDVCEKPPIGSSMLFTQVKTLFDQYMSLLASRALEETHPRPFIEKSV